MREFWLGRVAQRIRERVDGSVYLVAVMGYGQATDRDRTRAAGFYEHLVKPVEHSTLQRLLATLAR